MADGGEAKRDRNAGEAHRKMVFAERKLSDEIEGQDRRGRNEGERKRNTEPRGATSGNTVDSFNGSPGDTQRGAAKSG